MAEERHVRLFRAASRQTMDGSAGFTLIEVLVALGVVATVLVAIGSLIAANVRGTRILDQQLSLTQTARVIMTGLPNRTELSPGRLSGETANHRWRIDVQPFVAAFIDRRRTTPWVPQAVVVQVQSPAGQLLRIETVRLRRAEAPR